MGRTKRTQEDKGNDEEVVDEVAISNPRKRGKKEEPAKRQSENDLIEKSAAFFFKNQQYGSKGIRKEMKRHSASDIRLDPDDYSNFYSVYQKSMSSEVNCTAKLAQELLWLGVTNQNILIYGFGEKSDLLEDYAEKYLVGEDVIAIRNNTTLHCHDPNVNSWIRTIKSLLNTVRDKILKDYKSKSLENDLTIQQYCQFIAGKNNFSSFVFPCKSHVLFVLPI
jgi:hypothetical protein